MPISQTDQLINLIQTLTKSEKRNFRLYAKRIQDTDSLMYLRLFDLVDGHKVMTDAMFMVRLGDINRSQFSNLKRHLYNQILVSLRLIHRKRQTKILINEYLDFAQVLYGKGLYMQSLKLFEKARKLAEKNHEDFSVLMIIEAQKSIESRHITRSGPTRSTDLMKKASKLNQNIYNRIELSNLRILLHGLYIKKGHARDNAERQWLTSVFEDNLSGLNIDELGIIEMIYLYQSYVWYYYILQDFVQCGNFARKWVILFNESPGMIEQDVDLYMRGYHYLLTAEYNLGHIDKFEQHLQELEDFRKTNYPKFNTNSQIISFLYVHYGRLNRHFLHGTFQEGLEVIPRALRRIRRYRAKLDEHRIMVFYFKFAWMYLGAGKPGTSIEYLNKIMALDVRSLREDIQCYTRILLLMAHYELANYDVIAYLMKQVEAFFGKVSETNQVQDLALQLFKDLIKAPLDKRIDIMKNYLQQLRWLEEEEFEKRAFVYLDIKSWIEAKVCKVSLGEAVQRRFVE